MPSPMPASIAEPLRHPVEAVIAAIETDVIRGRILPRTRLIEDHLMEDYGAKRHVVRAALAELERLGVVIKPRHRGAEIRRFDADQLEQLYATRAVLHRAAVAMMRLPPDPNALAALELALLAHEQASAKGDLIAIHRSNMAFHRQLYGLCENQYLAESIRLHDWLSFPVRAYGVADPHALRQACEEHARMVEAVRQADSASLDMLSVEHMGKARRIYEAKFLLPLEGSRAPTTVGNP
ncbi:GntR family transcriptional regulator [uncultured Enterovirga sp.]|uniref:GntR family transcriptional regulator n=1 Tax=uncultured Enterovirga sp. TaxID=2026352 RepID=UPI0035C9C715